MDYDEIYTKPITTSLVTYFPLWGLDFDRNKSINENLVGIAEGIAQQCLTLRMYVEAHDLDDGLVVIKSDAFEDAFFSFDLVAATRGAAHQIVTDYLPAAREANFHETKAKLEALRAKFQEAADILNDAIENPDKYD